MKRQITFAITTLLMITGLASCQKDGGATVVNAVAGQWKVAKIETTISGTAPVIYTGKSSDYFEFRRNEENEMVVNLNSASALGTYVVLEGKLINIVYNGKLRRGKITNISDTNLDFTATVDGEAVETTEKYYFTR